VSLVGKIIDAYCTRCKLTLAHVVLSEMNGTVSQVECKTCGAQHLYRRGSTERKTGEKRKPATPSWRSGVSSSGRKPVGDTAMLWESKHQALEPETPIRPYDIHDAYVSREVIRHPVFGVGFVERVVSETRMQVLFKDAVKLMAMNTPE